MAVVLLQPLVFCSSRPKQRRSCCMLLPPVAGCAAAEASPPPTIPTPGPALPRRQPHTAAELVNPRTPLCAASTAASSPAPRHPLPRPHRRPPPWCSRRGVVNVVNDRLPSEEYCTERLTAGSTAAARKCLLITRKIIIPPPDSRDPRDGPPYFAKKCTPPDCWDPPATSSHARKCVRAKKTIRP